MSTPPQKPFELAIIGGGITGVTLAIALQKRNIQCTIYEQSAGFGEIGAGVGLHPNGVRAMAMCDPRLVEAFEKIATRNKWPSKEHIWFDFLDGTSDVPAPELKPLFTVEGHGPNEGGGVHRARFLEEMVKLLPADIARFNKRLDTIVDDTKGASGKMVIKFCDGSTAEADAVLGCDGIKSRTREIVVGENSPEAKCKYSHKYAYRGLIPMEDAIEALGHEKAENAQLWMGPDRHVLTFLVNRGATMNLVAFVSDLNEWPSGASLVQAATKEQALKDFEGFGPNVLNLINKISGHFDKWGLFDLADNPVSSFCKGRICLVGDAAHASTPHHGAGAGFCLEDCAVLSFILADDHIQNAEDLDIAFQTFDASRRERDQWLPPSSRRAADIYELRHSEIKRDYSAMMKDIIERQAYVWNVDLDRMVAVAHEDVAARMR